jgi:hypothetical protein
VEGARRRDLHGSDTGSPYAPWQAWISWFVARMATPVFVSRDATRRLGCTGAAVIPAGVDVDLFLLSASRVARQVDAESEAVVLSSGAC